MTKQQNNLILKGLLFGYADIVVNETPKSYHNEFWVKQSKDLIKHIKKAKAKPVNSATKKLLDKKYKEMASFDSEYFEDKQFSAYLCMITILEYLIKEDNDLILKSKFGHYNFNMIREELDNNKILKPILFDTNKFLTAILDKLEG